MQLYLIMVSMKTFTKTCTKSVEEEEEEEEEVLIFSKPDFAWNVQASKAPAPGPPLAPERLEWPARWALATQISYIWW